MEHILLGAPGSGKGATTKMLTDIDRSVQILTGDILRGAVQAGNEKTVLLVRYYQNENLLMNLDVRSSVNVVNAIRIKLELSINTV